jgi:predicted RNA-binding protein with PUA-like domain
MRYWLFKTEPGTFSFDDLMKAPKRTTHWDGIRNYQARGFLRDDVKVGDPVFIYHSSIADPCVAGIAKVTRAGYPDHTAFDRKDPHYGPDSDPESPTWYMVDVQGVEALPKPVTLSQMKAEPALAGMNLLRKGNRLSIQEVRPAEWAKVCAMGGKPKA